MVRRMPIMSAADRILASLETKRLRRDWNPDLHPRDSKGRFVETGGIARLWGGGMARVLRALGGRDVLVENLATRQRSRINASRLTMVARPDGTAPTKSKAKVRDEDERRYGDENRAAGFWPFDPEKDEGDAPENANDDNEHNDRGDNGHTPDDPHDLDDEGNPIGEDVEGEDLGAGPDPDDDDHLLVPQGRVMSNHKDDDGNPLDEQEGRTQRPSYPERLRIGDEHDPAVTDVDHAHHVVGNGDALRAAGPLVDGHNEQFWDTNHARRAIRDLTEDYFADLEAVWPRGWRNEDADRLYDELHHVSDVFEIRDSKTDQVDQDDIDRLPWLADDADELSKIAHAEGHPAVARYAANLRDALHLASSRFEAHEGKPIPMPRKRLAKGQPRVPRAWRPDGKVGQVYSSNHIQPGKTAPAKPAQGQGGKRFANLDALQQHWQSGNLEPYTSDKAAQERHQKETAALFGKLDKPQLSRKGTFVIAKMTVQKDGQRKTGYAVIVSGSGVRLAMSERKGEAVEFANRLEAAQMDGQPFDWDAPGYHERLESPAGQKMVRQAGIDAKKVFADKAAKKKQGAAAKLTPATPAPDNTGHVVVGGKRVAAIRDVVPQSAPAASQAPAERPNPLVQAAQSIADTSGAPRQNIAVGHIGPNSDDDRGFKKPGNTGELKEYWKNGGAPGVDRAYAERMREIAENPAQKITMADHRGFAIVQRSDGKFNVHRAYDGKPLGWTGGAGQGFTSWEDANQFAMLLSREVRTPANPNQEIDWWDPELSRRHRSMVGSWDRALGEQMDDLRGKWDIDHGHPESFWATKYRERQEQQNQPAADVDLPKRDDEVITPDGRGTVMAVNEGSGAVLVRAERGTNSHALKDVTRLDGTPYAGKRYTEAPSAPQGSEQRDWSQEPRKNLDAAYKKASGQERPAILAAAQRSDAETFAPQLGRVVVGEAGSGGRHPVSIDGGPNNRASVFGGDGQWKWKRIGRGGQSSTARRAFLTREAALADMLAAHDKEAPASAPAAPEAPAAPAVAQEPDDAAGLGPDLAETAAVTHRKAEIAAHIDSALRSTAAVLNDVRDPAIAQRVAQAVEKARIDGDGQPEALRVLASVLDQVRRALLRNDRIDMDTRHYKGRHLQDAQDDIQRARQLAEQQPKTNAAGPATDDAKRAMAAAELEVGLGHVILAQRGANQGQDRNADQIDRAQRVIAGVRSGSLSDASEMGDILGEVEEAIRGRDDLDEGSKRYWLAEMQKARRSVMRGDSQLDAVPARTVQSSNDQQTPTPTRTTGESNESVRQAGSEVLGDVPADGVREAGQRGGEDGVLRDSREPRAGEDRRDGGRAVQRDADGDDSAGSGREDASPVAGEGDRPGGRGVPAEGARNGAPGAGDESAARRVDAPRFHPTSQADLAPSGERAKARANVAAVQTLRRIQAEDRPATPEEQEILARWSGWGSLPVVLSDKPSPTAKEFRDSDGNPNPDAYARALKRWESFAEERAEIRALLNDTEWAAAKKNTLNAHYTDSELVQPIWDLVSQLGFRRGRVLEPGSGSGNFIGHAPPGADMVGVELDPTTAAISQLLYPDARVVNQPFQDLRLPPDSFDVAIGNVPFGNYKLHDPIDNPGRHHSIHDHFILKSLGRVRPGGLVAVVTSRYTMDAESESARRRMFDVADLVGAVRLPEGAHQRAAGTHVVTDLLVFRRRDDGQVRGDDSWVKTSKMRLGGHDIAVNTYFQKNPRNILGELTVGRGQFSDHDLTVKGDQDTTVALRAALARMAADARTRGMTYDATQTDTELSLDLAGDVRDGTIARGKDGSFMTVEYGNWTELDVHPRQREQLGRLLDLKEIANALVELERTTEAQGETEQMGKLRAELNRAYDQYVKKHGSPNKPGQRRQFSPPEALERRKSEGLKETPDEWKRPTALALFENDPDGLIIFGLDKWDAEAKTARKLDILGQRTSAPRHIPDRADTPEDAVALALEHDGGRLRESTIARLLGIPEDRVHETLGDLAFVDPSTGRLEARPAYLSGNVRAKLAEARAAAVEDPKYQANVAALEKVVPKDLKPREIRVKIGAPWVPLDVYNSFLTHLGLIDATVEHFGGNAWAVNGGDSGEIAMNVWGAEKRSAGDIFSSLLHQKQITVKESQSFPDGSKKTYINHKATKAARSKAKAMAQEFQRWVMADEERAERLSRIYNDAFNSIALRNYDSSPLALPGIKSGWMMRPHQNAAIRRIVQEPTTLLGHVVGAGKTATMVGGAMELRRTGLAKKPAIVVPNHMLEQFSREFVQLYPGAKVLAISRKDLHHKKRRQFIAKIAGGDWDAVILTHNAFDSIPMLPETQRAYMDRELALLREQIEKIKERDGESQTLKQMEKTLSNQEEALKERLDRLKDERGIFFENTGIDYVFVDEAHEYKNLRTISNIPGAAIAGSGQATQLHMVLEHLREVNQSGRVATLATGTPIANSVTEAYVLMRYLAPQILEESGIHDFDSWAATFGEVITSMEKAADGSDNYVEKARFAKFFNVPELLMGYRTFADIQTAKDLGLPTPTVRAGENGRRGEVITIPASEEQKRYVASLEHEKWIKEPGGVLKAIGFASRAAIDMRLQGGSGHEGGKLDAAAPNIADIYRQHKDQVYPTSRNDLTPQELPGALQLVFLDDGTPGSTGLHKWNAYEYLRERLVEEGVPREMVRFIHEAKDDKAKAKLFEEARSGKVAVLIGSTSKMGTGTNVQDRAVALHHLSYPWRPADMEQRDGRIERQGNLNSLNVPAAPGSIPEDVRILYYITENTFDEFRLGTLERKAVFINQMARRDFKAREMEDIGDVALSLGSFRAIASGNPAIAERANAQAELVDFQRLDAQWDEEQADRLRRIETLGKRIGALEEAIPGMADALQRRQDVSGDNFRMTVDGEEFEDRVGAATALGARLAAIAKDTRHREGETIPLGELGGIGFLAEISYDADSNRLVRLRLDHPPAYRFAARPDTRGLYTARKLSDTSGRGAIQSLENLLKSLEADRDKAVKELADARQAREVAQQHIGGTNPYRDAVASAERRMQALTDLVMGYQTVKKLKERAKEVQEAGGEIGDLRKQITEAEQQNKWLQQLADADRPNLEAIDNAVRQQNAANAAEDEPETETLDPEEVDRELTAISPTGDRPARTTRRDRAPAEQSDDTATLDPQQVRSDLDSIDPDATAEDNGDQDEQPSADTTPTGETPAGDAPEESPTAAAEDTSEAPATDAEEAPEQSNEDTPQTPQPKPRPEPAGIAGTGPQPPAPRNTPAAEPKPRAKRTPADTVKPFANDGEWRKAIVAVEVAQFDVARAARTAWGHDGESGIRELRDRVFEAMAAQETNDFEDAAGALAEAREEAQRLRNGLTDADRPQLEGALSEFIRITDDYLARHAVSMEKRRRENELGQQADDALRDRFNASLTGKPAPQPAPEAPAADGGAAAPAGRAWQEGDFQPGDTVHFLNRNAMNAQQKGEFVRSTGSGSAILRGRNGDEREVPYIDVVGRTRDGDFQQDPPREASAESAAPAPEPEQAPAATPALGADESAPETPAGPPDIELPKGQRWVHKDEVRPGDVVRFLGSDGTLDDGFKLITLKGYKGWGVEYDSFDAKGKNTGGYTGSWHNKADYVAVVDSGPARTAANRWIKRFGDYMRDKIAEGLERWEERRAQEQADAQAPTPEPSTGRETPQSSAPTAPAAPTPEPSAVPQRQRTAPSDARPVPDTAPADMDDDQIADEVDGLDERLDGLADATDPVDLAYRLRLEQRRFQLEEEERRRWTPTPEYDENGKEKPRKRGDVIRDRLAGYGLNQAETQGLAYSVDDLPAAKPGGYSDEEWARIDADASARESYPPTDEQRVIIEGAARRGLNMAVMALAGTGKSSTLKMLSHRMPGKNIVYLAFNRSVAAEAREAQARGEYAKNLTASTANAYAAKVADKRLNNRLPSHKADGFKKLSAQQIADRMSWYDTVKAGDRDLTPGGAATVAERMIQTWAKSADAEMGPQHITGAKTAQEARDLFNAVKPLADRMWANLTDPERGDADRDLTMDFDYIVKMWALGGYKMDADTLFWDEAQDVNPVMEGVVRGALDQGVQVVAVGDSNQAIYGFRGAADALGKLPVDARATLTQSFRFGPAVADVGNRFLRLLGTRMRLKGFDRKNSRRDTIKPGDETMVIARTNAGVALAAVEALAAGRRVAVSGGVKDLQEFVQAARALADGERTNHAELARFNGMSYEDILEAVKDDPDLQQLKSLFQLLEKHPDEIDQLMESGAQAAHAETVGDRVWITLDWNDPKSSELRDWFRSHKTNGVGRITYDAGSKRYFYQAGKRTESFTKNGRTINYQVDNKLSLEDAKRKIDAHLATMYPAQDAEGGRLVPEKQEHDVLVTTAHKSKGLESERVRIADDFRGPEYDDNGHIKWDTMPDDEALRVAYVAVTRATDVLDPGSLGWVFEAVNDDDPTIPPKGEYRRDWTLDDLKPGDQVDFQEDDGTPNVGTVSEIDAPFLTVLSTTDGSTRRQEIGPRQVQRVNGQPRPRLPIASDDELNEAITEGRYPNAGTGAPVKLDSAEVRTELDGLKEEQPTEEHEWRSADWALTPSGQSGQLVGAPGEDGRVLVSFPSGVIESYPVADLKPTQAPQPDESDDQPNTLGWRGPQEAREQVGEHDGKPVEIGELHVDGSANARAVYLDGERIGSLREGNREWNAFHDEHGRIGRFHGFGSGWTTQDSYQDTNPTRRAALAIAAADAGGEGADGQTPDAQPQVPQADAERIANAHRDPAIAPRLKVESDGNGNRAVYVDDNRAGQLIGKGGLWHIAGADGTPTGPGFSTEQAAAQDVARRSGLLDVTPPPPYDQMYDPATISDDYLNRWIGWSEQWLRDEAPKLPSDATTPDAVRRSLEELRGLRAQRGGATGAPESSAGREWKLNDWVVTPNGEGRVILAEDGQVVVLDGGGAPRTYEPRQLSLPGEPRTAEHDAPTEQEAARAEKRKRDLEAAQTPEGVELFYGGRLANLNLEEGHGQVLDGDGNPVGWVRRRGSVWRGQDARGGQDRGWTTESASDPLHAPREAAQAVDNERGSSTMPVALADKTWRHLRPEEGRDEIQYSDFSDAQREEFFKLTKEWQKSDDPELSEAAKHWGQGGLNYRQMDRLADELAATADGVDTSTPEGRRRQGVLRRAADKVRAQARRAWSAWQTMPPPGEPDAIGNYDNPDWVPYGHRETPVRLDAAEVREDLANLKEDQADTDVPDAEDTNGLEEDNESTDEQDGQEDDDRKPDNADEDDREDDDDRHRRRRRNRPDAGSLDGGGIPSPGLLGLPLPNGSEGSNPPAGGTDNSDGTDGGNARLDGGDKPAGPPILDSEEAARRFGSPEALRALAEQATVVDPVSGERTNAASEVWRNGHKVGTVTRFYSSSDGEHYWDPNSDFSNTAMTQRLKFADKDAAVADVVRSAQEYGELPVDRLPQTIRHWAHDQQMPKTADDQDEFTPQDRERYTALRSLLTSISEGEPVSGSAADDVSKAIDELDWLTSAYKAGDRVYFRPGHLAEMLRQVLDTVQPDNPRAAHHRVARDRAAWKALRELDASGAEGTPTSISDVHAGDVIRVRGFLNGEDHTAADRSGYLRAEPKKVTRKRYGVKQKEWLLRLGITPWDDTRDTRLTPTSEQIVTIPFDRMPNLLAQADDIDMQLEDYAAPRVDAPGADDPKAGAPEAASERSRYGGEMVPASEIREGDWVSVEQDDISGDGPGRGVGEVTAVKHVYGNMVAITINAKNPTGKGTVSELVRVSRDYLVERLPEGNPGREDTSDLKRRLDASKERRRKARVRVPAGWTAVEDPASLTVRPGDRFRIVSGLENGTSGRVTYKDVVVEGPAGDPRRDDRLAEDPYWLILGEPWRFRQSEIVAVPDDADTERAGDRDDSGERQSTPEPSPDAADTGAPDAGAPGGGSGRSRYDGEMVPASEIELDDWVHISTADPVYNEPAHLVGRVIHVTPVLSNGQRRIEVETHLKLKGKDAVRTEFAMIGAADLVERLPEGNPGREDSSDLARRIESERERHHASKVPVPEGWRAVDGSQIEPRPGDRFRIVARKGGGTGVNGGREHMNVVVEGPSSRDGYWRVLGQPMAFHPDDIVAVPDGAEAQRKQPAPRPAAPSGARGPRAAGGQQSSPAPESRPAPTPEARPAAGAGEGVQRPAGGRAAEATQSTVGSEAAPERPAVPEPIGGRPAEWVQISDVAMGDLVRIDGITLRGKPRTLAGYVTGGPELVPTQQGRKVQGRFRVLIADTPDGKGNRGSVWVAQDATAARATDSGAGTIDESVQTGAGSDVLTGRISDRVATDGDGNGLFPGSLITDAGGREGVVTGANAGSAQAQFGDSRTDEQVAPSSLHVTDGGAARPAGWTADGHRVTVGTLVGDRDGNMLGTVEEVDGDTVTVATPDGMTPMPVAGLRVIGRTADDQDAHKVSRVETVGTVGEGDVLLLPGPGGGPARAYRVTGVDRDGLGRISLVDVVTGETDNIPGGGPDDTEGSYQRLVDSDGNAADLGPQDAPPVNEPIQVNEPATAVDPVDGPTVDPQLSPEEREAIADRGTAPGDSPEVQQATDRIGQDLPVTPEQAAALANDLREGADTSTAEGRAAQRAADHLDQAAGQPTPSPAPGEAGMATEARYLTTGEVILAPVNGVETRLLVQEAARSEDRKTVDLTLVTPEGRFIRQAVSFRMAFPTVRNELADSGGGVSSQPDASMIQATDLKPGQHLVFGPGANGHDWFTRKITSVDVQRENKRVVVTLEGVAGGPESVKNFDIVGGVLPELATVMEHERPAAAWFVANRSRLVADAPSSPSADAPEGRPEPGTVGAVGVGDTITLPDANAPDTMGAYRVVDIAEAPGGVRVLTVEDGDGQRSTRALPAMEALYQLPEPGTPADPEAETRDANPGLDRDAFTADYADMVARAVVDSAIDGTTTPGSIHQLRQQIAEKATPEALRSAMRKLRQDAAAVVDGSGITGDDRDRYMADLRRTAQKTRVDAVRAAVRTLDDLEPLDGETPEDTAKRAAELLRLIPESLRNQTTPDDTDGGQAAARVADEVTAHVDGAVSAALAAATFADGEPLTQQRRDQVVQGLAQRLADGRQDAAQRIAAGLPDGQQPGVMARIVAALAQIARRVVELVAAFLKGLAKALGAAVTGIARLISRFVKGIARRVRSWPETRRLRRIAAAARSLPTPGDGMSLTDRVGHWVHLLPAPGRFGQVSRRSRWYRPASRAALAAGQLPDVQDGVRWTMDRTADRGPGRQALRHLAALRAAGVDIDADVIARLSAAAPELGDDPHGTVRHARRYEQQTASRVQALRAVASGRNAPELAPEIAAAELEAQHAQQEAERLHQAYVAALPGAVRDSLSQVREMGPGGQNRLTLARSSDAAAARALADASRFVPRDWLGDRNGRFMAAVGGDEGGYDAGSATATIADLGDGGLGSAVHALARHLQGSNPDLRAAAEVFAFTRTHAGRPGARRSTLDALLERLFGGRPEQVTDEQIVGRGLATMFSGDWYRDDDLRAFLLGLLATR